MPRRAPPQRLLTVVCLIALAACSGTDRSTEPTPGLRVAGFDFAESELLAEVYAQAVESGGIPVRRLGPIGPREVVAPAIVQGHIDLVPEYLGTALTHAGSASPGSETEAAIAELAALLAPSGIDVMAASSAQDRNAIVVSVDTASRHGLERISDLADLTSQLRFGGPPECADRPLCLVGLEQVYGLRFAEFVPQRSLAFTAESLRRGEIDVGLMFSTAAELRDERLVELTDDRRLQPAENIVPIVRSDALERWGTALTGSVDAVSRALTTRGLRELNGEVADGRSPGEVARTWLASVGLVPRTDRRLTSQVPPRSTPMINPRWSATQVNRRARSVSTGWTGGRSVTPHHGHPSSPHPSTIRPAGPPARSGASRSSRPRRRPLPDRASDR